MHQELHHLVKKVSQAVQRWPPNRLLDVLVHKRWAGVDDEVSVTCSSSTYVARITHAGATQNNIILQMVERSSSSSSSLLLISVNVGARNFLPSDFDSLVIVSFLFFLFLSSKFFKIDSSSPFCCELLDKINTRRLYDLMLVTDKAKLTPDRRTTFLDDGKENCALDLSFLY